MASKQQASSGSLMRISDIAQEPLETLAPIDGYENVPLVSIEAATVPLTALVPAIKHYVKEAKDVYGQNAPPEGLTIDEAASITLYTAEGSTHEKRFYRVLNDVLRSKNREELPPWYLYLKLLLTALSRLKSEHQFLFRGVKSDLSSKYLPNATITWWAFSSTTWKVDVLEAFLGVTGARTMFVINSRSGKNIASFSRFPDEQEVLIPPETRFRVIGSLNHGRRFHTIQLEEIDSPHNSPSRDRIPNSASMSSASKSSASK